MKLTQEQKTKPMPFWLFSLILAGILCLLFNRGIFHPDYVIFANDGPLGNMTAENARMPDTLTGQWNDLNYVGYRQPGSVPSFTFMFLGLVGPLFYSKMYAPLALFFLGCGARYAALHVTGDSFAATLTGLVAPLTSDFFGVAAWGVGPQAVCFGWSFFALGVLYTKRFPMWYKCIAIGYCVGMGVMEAYDIGAIFAVLIAICVVFHAITTHRPTC